MPFFYSDVFYSQLPLLFMNTILNSVLVGLFIRLIMIMFNKGPAYICGNSNIIRY